MRTTVEGIPLDGFDSSTYDIPIISTITIADNSSLQSTGDQPDELSRLLGSLESSRRGCHDVDEMNLQLGAVRTGSHSPPTSSENIQSTHHPITCFSNEGCQGTSNANRGRRVDRPPKVTNPQGIPSSQITPKDVLFGRGKHHRSHSGNETMRKLSSGLRHVYDKCIDRDQKTDITRYIVDTIRHNGGRFLKYKKEDRRWYAVSDEEARQKVSHVMRDHPAERHILNERVSSVMVDLGPLSPHA